MNLAVLFSGGKDSCLALHKALKEGHNIKYLLSIIPETEESWMFHKPNLDLLKRQAKMLGIGLVLLKSKGEKEKELADLENLIKIVKEEIEGIAVGGIASNYQRNRIKKICDKLDLQFYAPLWNYGGERLWKELLNLNFKVILTKIACEGLDETFLGKILDKALFEELKKRSKRYNFRIDFEGGEAETAVLWMPEFKKEIKIISKIEQETRFNLSLKISGLC